MTDHKGCILVVDDNPINLGILTEYLDEIGFEVLIADNGKSADLVLQYIKPDIILLDVIMPGIDGFEFCRQLKASELTQEIPVIFMTGLVETEHKVKGFAIGAIDYVTKPLQREEVLARVTAHLKIKTLTQQLQQQNQSLHQLTTELRQANVEITNLYHELEYKVQERTIELYEAYEATLAGLARALELRDSETEGHAQRVTEMTIRLAVAMGLRREELIHIRRGALLHDIGKLYIPNDILFKPGRLTEEEQAVMRQHPLYAYELLKDIPFLKPALDIPRYHHERWDGTGYNAGLKGKDIPLSARVFAVVDVWDALNSDRPYHTAWPRDKIRRYLRDQAGKHFDPEVVETFLKIW